MPDATITSTASTFGTISGTFAADQSTVTGTITAITGTLDGSVGVPGPAGPTGATGATGAAGAPGQGVAAGGTSGQVLQKLSGVNYDTGWLTLGTMSAATAADYSTTAQAAALYYPLSGNPSAFLTASALTPYLTSATAASTYQTLAGMSSYLTTATAASTYAVIAAGQPVAGTTGQVLTKQSGTNYDSIWTTIVPGDRYLTTSTTSNTISNGNKTFTIGTGLSYTPTQNLTISYNAGNHMHGEVLTYNSGTGVLTVDIKNHTGAGTYASWVVNVGGVTPLASVAWGAITGTLSAQTDLQNALDLKLTATTAATTYYLQTNPDGFIGDAPSDGSTYGRNNGAWTVAGGGGSYLPLAGGALDANASVTASDTSTATDSEMAGWGLGVQLTADHTQGTTVEFNGLDVYNGASHMTVTPTGLTFPDASVQSTAYTFGVRYNGQGSSGLISSTETGKLFYANNSTYTIPTYLDNIDFPQCELTFWSDNAYAWANFTISNNGATSVIFKGGITQMYGVGIVKALCMGPGYWLIYGDLSWIPYGTVISSSCTSTDGYDANNVYWSGAWYQSITIWDGAGGTIDTSGYNQGGCFYPAGYCTALGASTDNDSGYLDDSSNIMYYWSYVGATVENGSGGSSTGTVNRPVGSTISNIYTYNGISVYFAADGSGGFVLTNV